ncbi:MAG: hypothetical protein IJP02_04850 [Oscillospiraceae bacterium]|nr:hypothetical protein [Oscillospiraceae bacterium]
MADEKDMRLARTVYEGMCAALTEKEWKFKRFDDDLTVSLTIRGDDIPMDVILMVRPEAQVVSLFSPMPFEMSEDKRVDGAIAVAVANYGLVNGTFDYDISDGEIRFRMVQSYRESILGAEVYNYMLLVSMHTVDKYNDRFMMLSKGMIDLEKFVEMDDE